MLYSLQREGGQLFSTETSIWFVVLSIWRSPFLIYSSFQAAILISIYPRQYLYWTVVSKVVLPSSWFPQGFLLENRKKSDWSNPFSFALTLIILMLIVDRRLIRIVINWLNSEERILIDIITNDDLSLLICLSWNHLSALCLLSQTQVLM